MMTNQYALIRRELWEHRALYFVPAVLGLLIVLGEMTGQAAVSAFGMHIDLALLGASTIGEFVRGAIISTLMAILAGFFIFVMAVVAIFYSLDSLHAERKDNSILFWRSMPVTDAETVISKLLTALVVIPLITFVFIAITHLLVLLVSSVWVGMRGANAWHLIWSAVPLLDNWAATFIVMFALTLWLSPFVGWFLLVSAYAKRSPISMAVLPIIVLPMLERAIFKSTFLFDAIYARTGDIPIGRNIDFGAFFNQEMLTTARDSSLSLMSMIDLGRFLAAPGLWPGLLVCGLFVTGAIYVRRFRGES